MDPEFDLLPHGTDHLPPPQPTPHPLQWLDVSDKPPFLLPAHIEQLQTETEICLALLPQGEQQFQPPAGTAKRVGRTLIRAKQLSHTLQSCVLPLLPSPPPASDTNQAMPLAQPPHPPPPSPPHALHVIEVEQQRLIAAARESLDPPALARLEARILAAPCQAQSRKD